MVNLPQTLSNVVARAGNDVIAPALTIARNAALHLTGIADPHVGETPKTTIWKAQKAELWHYRPLEPKHGRPLVIVFSVLSRSYLFDLYAGNSFVEQLCDAGFDVYMLDWGVADSSDSATRFDDLVDDYLPSALRAAADHAGSDVAVLGYCFGGTLSVVAMAANPDLPVSRLVLLATPIDFDNLGLFTRMLGPSGSLTPDDVIDGSGNVSAGVSKQIFRVLKPTSEIASKVTAVERLRDTRFMEGYSAISAWTSDQVPFPGTVFRRVVEALFQRNALMAGAISVNGRMARPADITVPVLVVAAEADHLVPQPSALAAKEVIGDNVEILLLPFGHAGTVMGRGAARKTIPALTGWLSPAEEPATPDIEPVPLDQS